MPTDKETAELRVMPDPCDRTPDGRPRMNTPLWDACAVVIATARAIPVHHVGPRMVDKFWDAAQESGVLS